MLIEKSVFTDKKLKQIQQTNQALASLQEMLTITKQQRQLLESWLPKIECNNNYKRYQEEYDQLMLKERFLNKAIDKEMLKVLLDLDEANKENESCLLIKLN